MRASAAWAGSPPSDEVGVAVAQVLGEVEAAAVGHLRRRPRTAAAGKRAAVSAGERSTASWFPRRSASQASRVVFTRIATSASWRKRAGGGMWAWTSPVATVAHPQPVGQLGQQPVAAGVAAPVGALQLDREPLAAEHRRAAAGPAPRPRAAGPRPTGRATRAVAGAAREAVQALGVPGHLVERRRGRAAVVGVGGGDQPAQVAVAGLVLDEQGEVRAVGQGHLAAGDRPDAGLAGGVGEGQRAAEAVVVGQRERLVAELAARSASSSGWEAPSRNEKQEWAWSSA